jgi:hypothetical protein
VGSLTAWEGEHLGSKMRNALIYTYLEEEQISLRVSIAFLITSMMHTWPDTS